MVISDGDMHVFCKFSHQVYTVDNFCKRQIELEVGVTPLNKVFIKKENFWNKTQIIKLNCFGDILNHKFLHKILEKIKPENIVHYAETFKYQCKIDKKHILLNQIMF